MNSIATDAPAERPVLRRIHRISADIAHRALTIAAWVLVVGIALGFFDKEFSFAAHLPWVALAAAGLGLLFSFAAFLLADEAGERRGPARSAIIVSVVLALLSAGWMGLMLLMASSGAH